MSKVQARSLISSPRSLFLLLVAASAWLVTIYLSRGMSEMSGTMGLEALPFLGIFDGEMGAESRVAPSKKLDGFKTVRVVVYQTVNGSSSGAPVQTNYSCGGAPGRATRG